MAKNGGYLLQCTRNASLLYEQLLPILKEDFEVRLLVPQAGVMILDLDPTVDQEDLMTALKSNGIAASKINLRQLRGGKASAFLKLPQQEARKLLEKGRIQVGWTRARVRQKEFSSRCPKCLEIGHAMAQCKNNVDLRNQCFRCSKTGHKAHNCTANRHCNWCASKGKDNNHFFSLSCKQKYL